MTTNDYLKKQSKFYQFGIAIIAVLTLSTIFYFWKLGFVDGSRSSALYQANFIYNNFKEKSRYLEVKKLVEDEKSKKALEKVEELEKELEFVNKQIRIKNFSELKESNQKLKSSIANLLSFSNNSKVLNIFNLKLKKFHTYVQRREWKTLTRMSERILSKSTGYIERDKIQGLVKYIEKDFTEMTRLTEDSVLTRQQKSEILSRISNLNVEMAMLSKYFVEYQFFSGLLHETQGALNSWLKVIAPEITLQKFKAEQIGKYYIMGLIGLLIVILSFFFLSFPIHRKLAIRSRQAFEAEFENLVNKNLLNEEKSQSGEYSAHFISFLNRIGSNIQSLTTIGRSVEKKSPFGIMLLDGELNVEWMNNTALDIWSLQKHEAESLSWDFFNKLTNITDDDPVIKLLREKNKGQLTIKIISPKNDALDYQLHICPIKLYGNWKVMLFLNSLENINDLIKQQNAEIINPMIHALDEVVERRFEYDQLVSKKFKMNGCSDYYQKLTTINEHISKQKEIENNLIVEKKQFEDTISKLSGESKHLIEAIKSFKTSIIKSLQLNFEQRKLFNESLKLLNNGQETIQNGNVNSIATINLVKELSEVVSSFDQLKPIIKAGRKQFEGSGNIEDKEQFKKALSSIDRVLSKFDLIFSSEMKKIDFKAIESTEEQFSQIQEEMQNVVLKENAINLENIESEVIDEIKDVYGIIQNQQKILKGANLISAPPQDHIRAEH